MTILEHYFYLSDLAVTDKEVSRNCAVSSKMMRL